VFTTIAWAADGSAAASETLPFVEGLARATGAMLMIIHVQEVTISRAGFLVEDNSSVLASLHRIVRRLRDGGIHATVLSSRATTRDVPRTILDLAGNAAADVLVVGNRGHGPLINLVLGSVTDRILQIASLPIIVVPVRPAVSTPLADAPVAAVSTRSGAE
jgi:nucleotide-binding universal stress UspA family protein